MKRIIDISEQLYETCIRLNNEGDARPSAVCIANSLPYEERSKGKWINKHFEHADCSLCGRTNDYHGDFCKYCGAAMGGDAE